MTTFSDKDLLSNLEKNFSERPHEKEICISQFIVDYIDSSFDIKDQLPFKTIEKSLKKNTIITRYDQVENFAYFLKEGMVRISTIRAGEEKILDFFFPNNFFSSYTSFITRQTSDVQIETMTNCTFEVIRYEDMQKAYETSLLANKLGRIVAEFYYILKTNREKDFLTKSASERYIQLLSKRSELVAKIPVHLIAKYLGIKPESLSRIRNEIS